MNRLFFCVLAGFGAMSAQSESADYVFVPPIAEAEKSGPVGPGDLISMLGEDYPAFLIDTYAGQAKALRAASTLPEMQVGAGVTLDWTDIPLFGKSTKQGDTYHWRVALQSADATALRLKIKLGALRPNDELWVVDTVGNRPFGPFTSADSESRGRWLPTTMGDNVVLWVTSKQPSPPAVTVDALSHFYEPMTDKGGNPCPIPADCITNPSLQEISTGIGRLSITDDRGNSALCSGALINNAVTETLEAYFLTADHCFQDYPGTISATDLEVIWDFRADGCGGAEPSINVLSQLPRSSGSAFLGNSSTLDGMLLKLARVPIGTRGRAYLGWDTRTPTTGESVVCIHHPSGTAMKESIGTVSRLGVNTQFGRNQTSLIWSEGLTEGGSSGSPSVYNDGTFRIFGMLSNGNFQSCGSDDERIDQYSSFPDFFVQVGSFLTSETPPDSGRSTYVDSNSGTGNGDGEGALAGCALDATKSVPLSGDLLVGALALMTLAAWSRLRVP